MFTEQEDPSLGDFVDLAPGGFVPTKRVVRKSSSFKQEERERLVARRQRDYSRRVYGSLLEFQRQTSADAISREELDKAMGSLREKVNPLFLLDHVALRLREMKSFTEGYGEFPLPDDLQRQMSFQRSAFLVVEQLTGPANLVPEERVWLGLPPISVGSSLPESSQK